MNRGLKVFGDAGDHVVHNENRQIHDRRVPIPVDPDKLSYGSRSAALKYLMFLKMNRYRSIKDQGCANVRSKCSHTSK